jgi:3-deoxy-D-manno-octulosonic-acid transferase
MRFFYTLIYALGFVLLSPAFLYRMWKRGKYRENFFQRFGRYAPELRQRLATKSSRRCWIQAVSVGEVNLAFLLVAGLRRKFPELQLIVTTTTSTGYALARERLPKEVDLLYFPQDFPGPLRRAFNLIQPDFIVLMESELWPGHLWEAARRKIPVYLVNARMSPRSAKHYRQARWFCRGLFRGLSLVCAQSAEDAGNYIAQGVPADRVHMTGNMKYDASLPQGGPRRFDPRQVLSDWGVTPAQPVLVAGSTHPGEEEILFDLLATWRKKFPGLFLVLVPRHVDRTPEIVELAKRKQVNLALRKTGTPTGPAPACLLVNTTGELKGFYEISTVIFVGKSLVGEGGQNIVEAAASGHPVVFGPHMQNFKEISRQFVTAGAGIQVPDAAGLHDAIEMLLQDSAKREQVVTAARRVIAANVGALERTVELIAAQITSDG